MEVTAAVAVVLSVISGLVAAYAALRERKTADSALLVTGMQGHMNLLSAENADLRDRLKSAEQRIADLRVEVAHCEADKERLQLQLDNFERRLGGLEGAS